MFIAIGLLAPQPRLISISLWHQRKLPYWFTKVCYSHQLKPNLAYSPQGRLLRKRQDSVFERDYVSTPFHPSPSLEGEIYTSRCKPSSYCRLSSTSCTLGARRQDWVLGTMVFALHRVVQILSSCMKDISRNRVHQAYSAEGFSQGHFKTHDSEVGFEPTLIVLKTIELTICLFQIIAVCEKKKKGGTL